MKALIISIIICSFTGLTRAETLDVKSKITGVTVYLNGAQVTRESQVSITKGASTLVFRGLPENIDPQSIQAKGEGNFIILSILHQVNYLASQAKTPQIKMLEDSLRIYEDDLAWLNSQLEILKSEEDMLNANKDIGSVEKGVVLNDLKLAIDFHRARLSDIKKEAIKLRRKIVVKKERIDIIHNQLNALNTELERPTSEVLVSVSSEQNVQGRILLTYTVYDAGWNPNYDIRAKDIQNPVQLAYNAKVYQNTGESWNKVNIRLSTANPRQHGTKPEITPWFLDFEQPIVLQRQYNLKKAEAVAADMQLQEVVTVAPARAGTTANYTQVEAMQTSMEFAISIPYDIPSDNKPYTINIQEFSLPAVFEYYCAPRLDRDAFLLARITGWEKYTLLPGEINLFFEGTYVGRSYLDVRNTRDTLDLSLGRDKGIVVTRVKLEDLTSQRTIGSNKREDRTWEISVRNNKRQPVDLKIQDQLPVSMNKDIEIELTNVSGGKVETETGIITWKQTIEPGTEKKLRISFSVRYPKDKRVYID